MKIPNPPLSVKAIEFRIDLLSDFLSWIRRYAECTDSKERSDLKSKINRKLMAARHATMDVGALGQLSLAPPPAIGGHAIEGIDPFLAVFENFYGLSPIFDLADSVERAIGVYEFMLADVDDASGLTRRTREVVEGALTEIESMASKFSRDGAEWVKSTEAAKILGIESETLGKYRRQGISNEDNSLGRDRDGRVWFRPGTPKSHPWYLRKTLSRS